MVATCCKPSSGASVVWMDLPLGLTPSHEELEPLNPQDDPKIQILYQTPEMPKERKPEEQLYTEKTVERKLGGLNCTEDEVFSGHSLL